MDTMEIDEVNDDIDLISNPIQEFLSSKLRDIRAKNARIESELTKKKALLKEYLNNSPSSDDVKIEKIWKRVCNDFYVIAFKMSNQVKHVPMRVSNILLNWDSSSLITYKLNVFKIDEDNFDVNNGFDEEGIVVLSIEKPNFLKQLLFKIDAVLIYEITGVEYQINIPEFKIESNDFSDVLLELKPTEILNGNYEDLLILYSCYERFYLKGELNSFMQRDIATIFGIDCMFREINLKNNKKMFYIDGISTVLNGGLIEMLTTNENEFQFVVVCKDEEVLLQLLHYFYKNIQGIQILPKTINLELEDDSLTEALRREISIIKKYFSNGKEDKKVHDILEFRNELSEIQYETDCLYALSNNKSE
ncbi:uncharacterized protein [Onthophagus taurus]|uniref:uncharacterized protein n=1 Tax=Onthophagus taurus TaxID=166361 RepID=UPI0039BDFCE4